MLANRIINIISSRIRFDATHVALVVFAVSILAAPAAVECKFDVSRDVRFELHTREHSLDTFEELRVNQYGRTEELSREDALTIFNATRPTRIFVHGYWSSRRAFLRYARAFLHNADCNFIAVNWLNGSKTYNYWRARGRVERVSARGQSQARSYLLDAIE